MHAAELAGEIERVVKAEFGGDDLDRNLRRVQQVTGALHFQPGRKTAGLYGTAYGDIPVAVYTREVLTEEGENGGEIRLDYDVFVGGERTSATVMTLVWRL